jgi:hypothetical protein
MDIGTIIISPKLDRKFNQVLVEELVCENNTAHTKKDPEEGTAHKSPCIIIYLNDRISRILVMNDKQHNSSRNKDLIALPLCNSFIHQEVLYTVTRNLALRSNFLS